MTVFRRFGPILLLVGSVAIIYRQAVGAYFFEDDFQWLVTRWSFHPSDLFDLSSRSHFYRPVIELYFWIASPLFGGSPVAFHLVGIVLHIVNGGLVYLVAAAVGMRRRFAFVAALLFVVQPSYVAAVAWVGAIAEAIGAFFGCAAICALLRFRCTGQVGWKALSLAAFGAALLTHESSVVFLPLIVLADWTAGTWSWRWRDIARTYAPFVVVLSAYLAVDLTVNARHYVIAENQYRLGFHMISNAFENIASLYVGERTLAAHVVVGLVLAAGLIRGTAQARLAVLWMLLAMLPFLPFNTANVSRYAYLPAIGLALLLAEGVAVLATRERVTWRQVLIPLLVAFLAIRFAVFATKGVADVARRAETYRTFLSALRQTHPQVTNGQIIPIDRDTEKQMPIRYLEAAVQWEYRNPTIRLVVTDR